MLLLLFMPLCCNLLSSALTMYSEPTNRISHNCIRVLSVNKDREGDGERERERKRGRETEFLLQPYEIKKRICKEEQHYKQSGEKNLICNSSCPMASRATESEPMGDRPGLYFYNWMLILGGLVRGRGTVHTSQPPCHPSSGRRPAHEPNTPPLLSTHTHTHTHHATLYEMQALPQAWKLDMLGSVLTAGQGCRVLVSRH
jgi:hypothetical protein